MLTTAAFPTLTHPPPHITKNHPLPHPLDPDFKWVLLVVMCVTSILVKSSLLRFQYEVRKKTVIKIAYCLLVSSSMNLTKCGIYWKRSTLSPVVFYGFHPSQDG
jgi:hypothetical protein